MMDISSILTCFRPCVGPQIRNGCMGSGYVVVDVKADAGTIWKTLLDFERSVVEHTCWPT
jgi:hypothetical protein